MSASRAPKRAPSWFLLLLHASLVVSSCLLACGVRRLHAEDERPVITGSQVEDGHANGLRVGLSTVTVRTKLELLGELQGRHLSVTSSYTVPVSGILVVLLPRPGSHVEWPTAFRVYVPAAKPGGVAVANFMPVVDVSPIRARGQPQEAPRELSVRAYLLHMKQGAETAPPAGSHLEPYHPLLDGASDEERQNEFLAWESIFAPVREDTAALQKIAVLDLARSYVQKAEDPVARATAAALLHFLDEMGLPGTAYRRARLLTPPEGAEAGLSWVPPADPEEPARLLDHAARVDGEPLAWYHLFRTTSDPEERQVWALLLQTWENYCPGDHFPGVAEALQAATQQLPVEKLRELMVRAARVGSEAGLAMAKIQLAGLHLEGIGGVEEDPKAALRLADEAAQEGSVEACVLVGNLLTQPVGGSRYDLAARYFERAAEFGDPNAAYALAIMYHRAMLGLPDIEKAALYLGIAARRGHPEARSAMDRMLQELPDGKRQPVVERIDREMKAIEARLKKRAENIQKQRRLGDDGQPLWR